MTTIEKMEKGIISLKEFTEDQIDFILQIARVSFKEGQEQVLTIHTIDKQSCSHPNKEFVSGVFGGYWCPKCNRNVDSEIKQD